MSVALRSWASMMLLSFSGCEEREGGERRSVRGVTAVFDEVVVAKLKSEVVSRVTEGDISVFRRSRSVDRMKAEQICPTALQSNR